MLDNDKVSSGFDLSDRKFAFRIANRRVLCDAAPL
jgi:hypothetical protein